MKKILIGLSAYLSILSSSAQQNMGSDNTSPGLQYPKAPISFNVGPKDKVSGEYYDYTKTYKPERPYMFSYDKTLTMKMYLASKGTARSVVINFEQALRKIIQADNLTRGIPKIIYLVGWQYNGHDDKYPAWHEVNPALKRPQDKKTLS